jgi:hypothetical protein
MTEDVSTNDSKSLRLLFDSTARSKLRRTDPFEVREAYVWATRVANHPMFKGTQLNQTRLVQFAPIAALVREESSLTLGKSLKCANIGERHVRRLLAADRADVDEQLAKVVRLLGKKANIADLIATSIFWGERRIRSIAMDYFGIDDGDAEDGAAP